MSQPNPFLSSGASPSGSAGEIRSVAAGQGWAWIASGFDLFKKNPGIWIATVVILAIILIVLNFLNLLLFLGSIAICLLMPVFSGGLMLGCRDLHGGGQLEIAHLFAGFKEHTGSLVTLGAFLLVGGIAVLLVMVVITGPSMIFAAMRGDAAAAAGMGVSFLIAWLAAMGLGVLINMALWFAPALVVLNGVAPVDAVKQSFAACLKNIVPFLVYGIVMLVLAMIASIPLGLGWLVLGPVLIGSVYFGYRDIFGQG